MLARLAASIGSVGWSRSSSAPPRRRLGPCSRVLATAASLSRSCVMVAKWDVHVCNEFDVSAWCRG